nr:hypothetical protein [uncultured Ruegeria sp.]
MNDFKNLNKQRQTLLKIKIDGYIEAAILAAKTNNIGLSEAVFLTTQGLIREMAAQSIENDKARLLMDAAFKSAFPEHHARVATH